MFLRCWPRWWASPDLLSAMKAEGCSVIWKDIQRSGWRLWQLQPFPWSVLWQARSIQLAEGCAAKCKTWVTCLLCGASDGRLCGQDYCSAKAQTLLCVRVTRACHCFQEWVHPYMFCCHREIKRFCVHPVSPLTCFWLLSGWMRFSKSFPPFLAVIRYIFQISLCNE